MDDVRFLVGQFLLSMPGMGDPRFERAVIAICDHDAQGALGIVINQPIEAIRTRDLFEQLEIDPGQTPDAPVYAGGPVEPARGFVLHSPEYNTQGTILVTGGTAAPHWALTSTLDVLTDIAAGKGPRHWLMALGYTGWGPGQLDGEMTRHGWQNAPGSEELIWQRPAAERWAGAYAMIGINVALLSPMVGRA